MNFHLYGSDLVGVQVLKLEFKMPCHIGKNMNYSAQIHQTKSLKEMGDFHLKVV